MNRPFSQQQTKSGQSDGTNPLLFVTPVATMLPTPVGESFPRVGLARETRIPLEADDGSRPEDPRPQTYATHRVLLSVWITSICGRPSPGMRLNENGKTSLATVGPDSIVDCPRTTSRSS